MLSGAGGGNKSPFNLLIDGALDSGAAEMEVIDPASEASIAIAPRADQEQLNRAVAAANRAFFKWRSTAWSDRADILEQIAARLRARVEELAQLLTAEQGKPLASARAEIMVAAMWCDGTAKLQDQVTITEDGPERASETRRVPLGVVAAIVPWNFPIGLAFWKMAPALLAGNAVVLKPAPTTPLTILRIGEIIRDLLPEGVLNIISGGDELGPMLTSHPDIAKISFTGSTAVGREVMRTAAADIKRVTLELGGNDAAIVFPDVDIATVIPELFWGAFRNSGQFCVAAKRVYVHDAIYDEFAQKLVEFSETIAMGPGCEAGIELGPLQNKRQFDRVSRLIERARRRNLRFLTGQDAAKRVGYFIPVTIIDNPPDDDETVTEEAFGPVVPLLRFSDVDDVIRRANAGPYGLAGSVWTKDLELASEVARRLECGTVWINHIHHMTPWAPFGGHKQSGLGVENGLEGLLEYSNSQTIALRKPEAVE